MSGVKISDLAISFAGNTVIAGLNLEVHEGEFLVLLGPSGCGKSTLLHSIAGLIDVSGGRIDIGGEDMTWAEPSERGIGMVFQSYALYPNMSVEGNMSFGLKVAGVKKDEIRRRVAEAAALLQLQPLLSRKPSQLSGGQRQRVAIGRALVRQAGIFLFDEPLSNLDAKLRAELRHELKLLHRKLGATMIYVTHDQTEAMTLASRIVVMKSGVIQQIGAPTEVYEKPANRFVAGFLGATAMNFVSGQVRGGRFEGALSVDLSSYAGKPQEGQQVVLGLRPENLSLDPHGPWEAQLQLLEPMGSHHVAWLRLADGSELSAILPAGSAVPPEGPVRIAADLNALSLFDATSEHRV
ncbi:MAG: ABC transporter ATP-binding protein [Paucibacter sp.]|nr:ABC transporter ATP-binding protein [Roseateles sp.]